MVDEETTDVGHHLLDGWRVGQSLPDEAVGVPINHIHYDDSREL